MDFFSTYKDVSNNDDKIVITDNGANDTNIANDTKGIDRIDRIELKDVTEVTEVTEVAEVTEVEEEAIDIVTDTPGGIIYDILHIFDDIYVYGRTLIENNYFNLSENDEFSLVYPNIYIGNYSTSTNLNLLKDLGITHIVSVIPSFNPPFFDKFKYLHIQAYDDESQDIKQFFEISNEFISNCLSEGGKVLIHCMVGRSRSVAICMAFLINIIQGNFHKKSLNLENYNNHDDDIYNSLEYTKFVKNNKKQNYNYNNTNTTTNTNTNNTNTNNYENITKLEHIKPSLSNKEKFYIVYKKEVMLNEIDELINTYNILKKEISIKKRCEDSNSDNYAMDDSDNSNNNNNTTYKNIDELNQMIKNMKLQSGKHFIIQLLKYIKKYRKESNPNSYFITQLCEVIF